MMQVLAIGGVDPAGKAGICAVVRALALERVAVLPVSTGQTVQTDAQFAGVAATPADVLGQAIEAALGPPGDAGAVGAVGGAGGVGAVLIGALFGPAQVEAVADALATTRVPIVLDPVRGPSAGGSFLDDAGRRALLARLVPRSALVLPNADEASWLTGAAADAAPVSLLAHGAEGVLVTADGREDDVLHTADGRVAFTPEHHAGLHRGTGCRLAAGIAGRLASGMALPAAVAGAHAALQRELALDAADQALDPPRRALVDGLRAFLPAFRDALPAAAVPEVGLNLAYALPGATDPRRDVAGLAGRIAIAGDHHDVCGRVQIGGPHHTGRMAVVLQEIAPAARIVMNHALAPGLVDRAEEAGLGVASFSRGDEPAGTPSSMEWGLREALRVHREAAGRPDDTSCWPVVVWDAGGPGKEPMARLLARGPQDLLRILDVLHGPVARAA